MCALGRQCFAAAAAVCPPAAPVRDLPDLLHVHVEHVAGEPGGDRADRPVALSCRVEVATPADPESLQPARYRAQAAVVAEVGQFVVDAAGGPLVIATPAID